MSGREDDDLWLAYLKSKTNLVARRRNRIPPDLQRRKWKLLVHREKSL